MSKTLVLIFSLLCFLNLNSQENDLSGFELSIDQDYFADFLRDTMKVDRNYTIGMRLGFYGALANHDYLGLPWIRKRIDDFLLTGFLENSGFRLENTSHNFVFTVNGFSPSHISDQTPEFERALLAGYDFLDDHPFSSFTGFRSTRRIEGNKLFVHSARQMDIAITSSFTFGLANLGLAKGLDNLFGANRPDGELWTRDDTKPFPTGQVLPLFPLLMYSLSAEVVVWRPLKKIVLQVRPELNLGYYTNVGIGVDFGKVMNVEKHVDNLGYTDTNNPSLLVVNNDNLGFSLVGGFTARAVLYNAHVNGLFGLGTDHSFGLSETKKFVLEGYVGAKIQLLQKIEITFAINKRTDEFTGVQRNPLWGTLGLKYLLAPAGEGCYD